MRKSSRHNFCQLMALRNGEKVGITAPSPKRHKVGHVGVNRQDEVKQISDGESEDNADHLSAQKILPAVLIQRELNASTSSSQEIGTWQPYLPEICPDQVCSNFRWTRCYLQFGQTIPKSVGPVDKALRRLKVLIESIEDREPLTVGYLTPLHV